MGFKLIRNKPKEIDTDKYNKLINFLRKNGFVLELVSFYTNDKTCKHYTIWNKDKTVVGLLSTKDSTVDTKNRYNNSILFDNYEAFNKWSQAPVQLDIYDSDEYYMNLLKELDFLSTKEAEDLSDCFEYKLKFTKKYEKRYD